MADSPLLLTNVTKSYGKHRGIENVSFSLNKSEVFGFLGPNGAGKSTAIRTILNFISPSSGSISIFGQDSRRQSVEVKRRIGYLAGNFAAYGALTGEQLLSLLSSVQGVVDAKRQEELVARFGAELNRPIYQLSKGNQQKLGLIQAFMHSPDLVILDEPTSGLDPLMQERFYETVAESKAAGASLLVSSHNLTEVQRICDRAAFIRQGAIIGIEDIAGMKNLSVSKFVVTFNSSVKAADFSKVKNVRQTHFIKNVGNFTVQGDMDSFVKALAKHSVESIHAEQASLDDVFMRLYQAEEKS